MECNFVKAGFKGRHIKIPSGYALITTGEVGKHDMFLNLATLHWNHMDKDDIGCPLTEYDFVIRDARFIYNPPTHGDPK